jgi:hypothetical protein
MHMRGKFHRHISEECLLLLIIFIVLFQHIYVSRLHVFTYIAHEPTSKKKKELVLQSVFTFVVLQKSVCNCFLIYICNKTTSFFLKPVNVCKNIFLMCYKRRVSVEIGRSLHRHSGGVSSVYE